MLGKSFIAFLHKDADILRSIVPGVKAYQQRLVRQLAAKADGLHQEIRRFLLESFLYSLTTLGYHKFMRKGYFFRRTFYSQAEENTLKLKCWNDMITNKSINPV